MLLVINQGCTDHIARMKTCHNIYPTIKTAVVIGIVDDCGHPMFKHPSRYTG